MKLKKSCNMLCLFLLLMTLCLFLSLQVSAEGTAPSFVISGGVLESYEGTDTVVEVPYGVTAIGEHAFFNIETVEKVVLPATVREIRASAFLYCHHLQEINLPDTLQQIGDWAFYACPLKKIRIPRSITSIGSAAIPYGTYTECYKNTAGFEFVRYWNSSYYCVLDAIDISSLTFSLSADTFVYTGYRLEPAVTVKNNTATLRGGTDYYMEYSDNLNPGTGCITITANPSDGTYRGTKKLYFRILPRQVTGLVSGLKTSSKTVELQWNKNEESTHYQIYRYDTSSKKWKLLSTTTKTTYRDTGKKANTRYRYYVSSYTLVNRTKFQGQNSAVLSVYTLPDQNSLNASEKLRKKGATPETISVKTNVATTLNTTDLGWQNWSHVSPISEFKDEKGNYCFGYVKGSYYYIKKYNSKLKLTGSIKVKKKYPLFGSIACDADGYYYIVWGKNDTAGKTGVDTIAVSKYSAKGKHVKTTKFITTDSPLLSTPYITRYPFDAGNCVIAIKGHTLVCSMGREMYNGHQSNCIVSVNTATMGKLEHLSNYASHSFNQSLLATQSGEIVYVNHGDAYPRGIEVEKQSLEEQTEWTPDVSTVPFHFYGEIGNNYTGAQLGGIAEVSSGYMLAAAAPKSLNSKANSQTRNVFVQLLDKSTLTSRLNASTRKGTSGSESVTDKGIKWLTNYSANYTASAVSIVATDDDRVVVMWEKLNKNNVFLNSYYMILASNGQVLQKATSLRYRRLNVYEDPVYRNGYIYWTSASGTAKNTTTYRMKISKLKVVKTLGKPEGLKTTGNWMYPALIWEPLEGADGYELYRSTRKNGTYKKIKTLKANSTTSYEDTSVSAFNGSYYYKIRGYMTVGSKKITGNFSKIVQSEKLSWGW